MVDLEQKGLLDIPGLTESKMLSKPTKLGEQFRALLELGKLRADHVEKVGEQIWSKDLDED